MFAQYGYGADELNQYVRMHLPLLPDDESAAKSQLPTTPIVVIIHGGFWKEKYRIDNSAINLVPFFLEAGFAVCEIEYRRGEAGDKALLLLIRTAHYCTLLYCTLL